MTRVRPSLFAVPALAGVIVLTAACGASATAAAPTGTTASTPSHAAATPRIVDATLPAAPNDAAAGAAFGADNVVAAWKETIQLATKDAFNPAFFVRTGHNTPDLLQPIFARLTPVRAAKAQEIAAGCLNAVQQSCLDIMGVAYFDMGTPTTRFTYMPDGSFVTAQSVTNPRMSIDSTDNNRLAVAFDHTATVSLKMNDKPVVVTFNRTLTYFLVRAEDGNAHKWMVDNWNGKILPGSVTDPATGKPVPVPESSAPASPTT